MSKSSWVASAGALLLVAAPVFSSPGNDIQSRLDALNGPGTVMLEPRTYEVATTIELRSGQVLTGVEGATLLRWTGGIAPVIRARGSSGGLIGTATPDASRIGYALRFQGVAPEHVRVSQAWDSDVPLHELARVRRSEGKAVLADRLLGDFRAGAELRAIVPNERARIVALTIDGGSTASAGVALIDTDNAEVRNCTIENARLGIEISDSYFPSVLQNFIRRSGDYGISVIRSTGVQIVRNSIVETFGTGVLLRGGVWEARVDSNDVVGTSTYDEGGDGITIYGAGNVVVSNNRILRTACYGLWAIRHVYNLILQNNIVVGGGTGGLHFNSSPLSNATVRGIQLIGNIVVGNHGTAIILNPARDVVATQNIVDGHANRDGVLAYGQYGKELINSAIRDNIVYRDPSSAADPAVDVGGWKVPSHPLWPDRVPSPVDWERFIDYLVRGVPTKMAVRVESVGLGTAGAWLRIDGGRVIVTDQDGRPTPPAAFDLLRDAAATRPPRVVMPPGSSELELASLPGDVVRTRLGGGVATLTHPAGDGRYRIDVYADAQRIAISPFQKATRVQVTDSYFVADPSVNTTIQLGTTASRYRFVLIDQSGDPAGNRDVAIAAMQLIAGSWPFPLDIPIRQYIMPRPDLKEP